MKQCKNCSIEFEPKHETRGHEQMYCSIKCRTEAYKKRQIEKVLSNEPKESHHESKADIRTLDLQRSDYKPYSNGGFDFNVNLDILEGKYQAKTEALEYKLKYESVVKDLEDAKRKIFELEQELNEYDDEGEEESGDYMGSIMDLAKNSPELGNAIGKLLQNEKVQNFVINLIPDTAQNQ